jgi:hypothetical protein
MNEPTATNKVDTLLKPGWWVTPTLKPDTAPMRCYVGQIQALSNEGIRLTLVDWISGMADGYDVYVPHRNIESALVCTDKHDLKGFRDASSHWQNDMNKAAAEHEQEPAETQRHREGAEPRPAAITAQGEESIEAAKAVIDDRFHSIEK